MAIETFPFDPAELLTDAESRAIYLAKAFAERDPAGITNALGVVARAVGMTEVAAGAGLQREGLYKALSANGNPEFKTVVQVMTALGLQLAPVKMLGAAQPATVGAPGEAG